MKDIIVGRSEDDREEFGRDGMVLLGKQYIQMGRTTSLSNNVYLDFNTSHVVFICGKRGGGKCVTGDTQVTLGDDSKQPIKKLFDEHTKNPDEEEAYVRVTDDVHVKSYDLTERKITTKPVTHVYRRKVNEELVQWRFPNDDDTKSVTCTKDHKLLGIRGHTGVESRENEHFWTSYKDFKDFEYVKGYDENENGWFNDTHSQEDFSAEQLIQHDGYVYDITVEDTHNFIANDIVVHNSYTMGVMAEGVANLDEHVRQNLSIILVDTMGVYWTMKYANKQQADLLDEWGLEPKAMDPVIFTPEGYYHKYREEGIPTDEPFSITPSELTGQDWVESFGLDVNDDVGVLIERTIHDMRDTLDVYGINDILDALDSAEDVDDTTKNAAKNRFLNAQDWGLFTKDGTEIKDIAVPGKVSVLDVSCYATMSGSWKVKNLVMKLVADKLFTQRMKRRKEEEYADVRDAENPFGDERDDEQDFPLVWLIIDEAHEFLPHEDDGKTLATDPLVTILREGRQPGISLTVATQQPGKIHTDVMTQCDTVLSHRITAKKDTKALGKLMQSYMRRGLTDELNQLPEEDGAAVIFDDTNEKLHQMRVRPRLTWHGGSAPNAIHDT